VINPHFEKGNDVMQVTVSGMACGHCAQTVSQAVESVPGVERALVDLETGHVRVEGNAQMDAILKAIEEAGYGVRG
jgi:copper chaperone